MFSESFYLINVFRQFKFLVFTILLYFSFFNIIFIFLFFYFFIFPNSSKFVDIFLINFHTCVVENYFEVYFLVRFPVPPWAFG